MSTSTQTEQQANFGRKQFLMQVHLNLMELGRFLNIKKSAFTEKFPSLCELFNLNTNLILNELPQDDEGRILDYKTRHIIHDALLQAS